MQLCILANGWSPNTELSRAAGHPKEFLLSQIPAWGLNKTCSSTCPQRSDNIKISFHRRLASAPFNISYSLKPRRGLITQSEVFEKSNAALLVKVSEALIETTWKNSLRFEFTGLFCWWRFISRGSTVFISLSFFWSCPPPHGAHVNTVVCYSSSERLEAVTSAKL